MCKRIANYPTNKQTNNKIAANAKVATATTLPANQVLANSQTSVFSHSTLPANQALNNPLQFVIPGHVALPDDDIVAPDYYVVYNGIVISLTDIYSHKEVVVDGKVITKNNYKSITYPLIVASDKYKYDQDLISISSYHDLQLVVEAFDDIIDIYKDDYTLIARKLWKALKGIKISSFDAYMLIDIFEYLDEIMNEYTNSYQDMVKRYYLIMIKLYYIKVAHDDLGGLILYAADIDISEQLMPGLYDELNELIEDKNGVVPNRLAQADKMIKTLSQQPKVVRDVFKAYARKLKQYSELYNEVVKDIKVAKYDYLLLNDDNIIYLIETILRYIYLDHDISDEYIGPDTEDDFIQHYILIAENLNAIIDSYINGYDFTVLDNIGDLSDYAEQILEELEPEDEEEEDQLLLHLRVLAYDTYKQYKELLESGYEVREIDEKLAITDSWQIIEAYENRIITALNKDAIENLRITYYSVVLGRVFTIYKIEP